jgi:hypothetical protein
VGATLFAAPASFAGAATTAHSETIEVRCASSGFIRDANAFHGQRVEVSAFYRATGIVCRSYDGETAELLFDPSA